VAYGKNEMNGTASCGDENDLLDGLFEIN